MTRLAVLALATALAAAPAQAQTLRWAAGTEPGHVSYAAGAEMFVLEGDLRDETGRFGAGTWLRLPVGARHRPATTAGCVLYIKEGGLAYLTNDKGGMP